MAEYIFLLSKIIVDETGEHEIKINAVLDRDWEYSGDYKVIIDDGTSINICLDENAAWVEQDKNISTELTKLAGDLIENFYE
jgi:hypothetical protein